MNREKVMNQFTKNSKNNNPNTSSISIEMNNITLLKENNQENNQ